MPLRKRGAGVNAKIVLVPDTGRSKPRAYQRWGCEENNYSVD